jgi:kinesin family protein 3/17
MNEASSRSHSILSFYIESRESKTSSQGTAPVHLGKLHLVDLAGSERLNKSGTYLHSFFTTSPIQSRFFRSLMYCVGAEGINQKEAQNINSSLTALGDVLAALSSKNYNGPIPYRNSKLTRLLQDSLGGNSKTFFIVNIDPATHNYQETMMSLMYGQRAKKIKNITMLNKDVTGKQRSGDY